MSTSVAEKDVKRLLSMAMQDSEQREGLNDAYFFNGKFADAPSVVQLRDRHYTIMQRLLAGEAAASIARSLGMNPDHIYVIISSPAFQLELQRQRDLADRHSRNLWTRLQEVKHFAMDVVEETIKAPADGLSPAEKRLRASVALNVLDRTSEIPTVSRQEHVTAHLTKDDIEDMKRRACGHVVEVQREKEADGSQADPGCGGCAGEGSDTSRSIASAAPSEGGT